MVIARLEREGRRQAQESANRGAPVLHLARVSPRSASWLIEGEENHGRAAYETLLSYQKRSSLVLIHHHSHRSLSFTQIAHIDASSIALCSCWAVIVSEDDGAFTCCRTTKKALTAPKTFEAVSRADFALCDGCESVQGLRSLVTRTVCSQKLHAGVRGGRGCPAIR